MKTRFPVMIGCATGLAAVVACFVGFASSNKISESLVPYPEVTGKSSLPEPEDRHRYHRQSQSGTASSTPSARALDADGSQYDTSSSQVTHSARSVANNTISNTHRNSRQSGHSPSSEASADRMAVASGVSANRIALPNEYGVFTQLSREKSLDGISEPLIFTDPGSILSQENARDAALLEAAEQLARDLVAPGHAQDSREYSDHWIRTVNLSNELLRQRYGGQVWMAHHIQSHHLQTSTGEGN